MQTFLFLAAQLFPMWAIPVMLILAELARYFYRKARKGLVIVIGLIEVTLVGLLVLYFWKSGWMTFPNFLKSLFN